MKISIYNLLHCPLLRAITRRCSRVAPNQLPFYRGGNPSCCGHPVPYPVFVAILACTRDLTALTRARRRGGGASGRDAHDGASIMYICPPRKAFSRVNWLNTGADGAMSSRCWPTTSFAIAERNWRRSRLRHQPAVVTAVVISLSLSLSLFQARQS